MARIYTQNRGFQVGARASRITSTQSILTNAYIRLFFNSEDYDLNSNFDITSKSGTATATLANHLVDSAAAFVAADVGRVVWNTTDNTYARITVVNSATDVTIDTDIMVNTEAYTIFDSRFTAPISGIYIITGNVVWESLADGTANFIAIRKNYTVELAQSSTIIGAIGVPLLSIATIAQLAINDIVTLDIYQNTGTNKNIQISADNNLAIQLLSR